MDVRMISSSDNSLLFISMIQAVPETETINIDLSLPEISSKSTLKPTIAFAPKFNAFCFNAFDASPYIISNFLLYESERPPKKSVNDAAKSENILVPITILEQMVSIYFFIGQPSIVLVVDMINSFLII